MQEYFASLPADQLANKVQENIKAWTSQATSNGLKALWQRLYYTYFGRHWKSISGYSDSDIARVGLQGEFMGVTVNDFRNIIKHMLVLTTNQKISYEPRATNTDESSLTQTRLAKIIIDYYVREKKVDRYLHDQAEMALVLSKAFLKCTWDKQAGRPFTTEQNEDGTERIIYEGDIKLQIKDPFQVFVDQNVESWDQITNTTDISWVNRWDYIARFPELKDYILSLPTKDQFDNLGYWTNTGVPTECDLIALYEFYHKRTPALPNGRYLSFLGPDAIIEDGPIPYRRLPIFPMFPSKWWGSTEGYTEARDLLGLSQANDTLWSCLFTNNATFGVQNIASEEGTEVTAQMAAQGLRHWKYPRGGKPPHAVQLTQSPPEMYKLVEMIGQKMETIMGLNSVSRGNISEDLSGKAMGLLQSMSIQYASAFQASYAEAAEELGTFILWLIKDFAKTKRMASIVGKFNATDMIQYSGDDISDIERVVVNLQNPYMSTMAGKKEMADTLLNAGVIKEPQQYLTFIETGNFEVMTQYDESKLSMIRQENEALMDGKGMIVHATVGEPHLLHAREHLALISRPDIKANSILVQDVYRHVQEHLDLYKMQDPLMATISGEPPYVPPPPMPLPEENIPGPGPQQGQPQQPEQPEIPPPPGPEQALSDALKN